MLAGACSRTGFKTARDPCNPVPCRSMSPEASPPSPACHCIIKLGGAGITDKSSLETLRPLVLGSVAQQVKAVYEQYGPEGIVVVHGAGSFGHFQAKQYSLVQGGTDPASAREGFVLTRQSVTKLQHIVVSALIEAGVPAVGLSPYCTYTTSNRELLPDSSHLNTIQPALGAGLVPVLHGDAVHDQQLGCTILSGDTVVRRLAELLRPKHVVFLTNVPGIFDRPPEEPGAQLLPSITVSANGKWELGDATASDRGDPMTAPGIQQAGQQPAALAGAAAASKQQRPADGINTGSSAPATTTSSSSSANSALGGPPAGSEPSSSLQEELSAAGSLASAAAHDTTGGMAMKIKEAAAIAELGIPVVIAEAGSAAGAAAALEGPAGVRGLPCTVVTCRESPAG